jgi:hypothetical protein
MTPDFKKIRRPRLQPEDMHFPRLFDREAAIVVCSTLEQSRSVSGESF